MPDDALLRPELDRSRVVEAGDRVGDSCETEELRRCPLADSSPFEGVMMADLGLDWDCGAGDGEDRVNGLARLGELFS